MISHYWSQIESNVLATAHILATLLKSHVGCRLMIFFGQIWGVLILSNLILSSIVISHIQFPEYYHQSDLIFFLRSGNGRDRKQTMIFSVSYTNEPENISINNLSLTEIFEEAIISATKRQNIFTYYQYLS